MEAKLLSTLFMQGTGFIILAVLVVRFIWSILGNAKWAAWQVTQMLSVSRPSDNGEIFIVEVVVERSDQKLACNRSEFDQLPAKIDLLSTAPVLPPSSLSPSAKVISGAGDHKQTSFDIFYNVYKGVSPRTRLL